MNVEEAVEAPRVHCEAGVAHCEDPAAADALEAEGRAVCAGSERNLYFGGVSAVECRDGDARGRRRSAPRRSGLVA